MAHKILYRINDTLSELQWRSVGRFLNEDPNCFHFYLDGSGEKYGHYVGVKAEVNSKIEFKTGYNHTLYENVRFCEGRKEIKNPTTKYHRKINAERKQVLKGLDALVKSLTKNQ